MPEKVDECVQSVMEDNPDMSESRAFAICNAMQNEGELSDVDFNAELQEEDPCEEGWVMVGTKQQNGQTVPNCVPEEDADEANLSAPRMLASASPLDTQPIEREELEGGKVAYRNLKLIDTGIWTDQKSETPTLYDERTFENTEPEFDNSRYNGPPVNIAHDVHKTGRQKGEPHEASVGGHIDPDSIRTDGEALFGDVILDRDTDAGAFADTNLKSALENDGSAGFSPSVELTPTEEKRAEHVRADSYVAGAKLTGLGLVRDPASKSVDLQYETMNRGVALSDGEQNPKVLERERRDMADAEEVRETLEEFGVNTEGMDDEELMDMAESMHDELMPLVSEGMENGDDMDDEDEEDEEEMDMMDDSAIDVVEEQIDDLWDTVDEIKETMMTDAEREELETSLAAAEDVNELREEKEDLEKRLSELEAEPENPKTLAESENGESEIEGTVTPASTRDRIDGSIRR